MATYNIKKESKVYLVHNGLKYVLDVYPDLNFSQTFNETNIKVKTLHAQLNMFDKAVIVKANPANFNFTIPILSEDDMKIVIDLLLTYNGTSMNSFDLYIESSSEVYKLEKAVIESGILQMDRNSIIVLSIAGTAKKLSKHTTTIPGTLQVRSSTRTHIIPTSFGLKIGSEEKTKIVSVSVEFKNNVQWLENTTLHNSLPVVSASDTVYPEAFVVDSRTFSGNVQQYVTDENNTVNTWNMGNSLTLRVGNLKANWLMEVYLPSIVCTNRLEVQDLFLQSYDFRMDVAPADITQQIKILHASANLNTFANIWAVV